MSKSALKIYRAIREGDEGIADQLIERKLNESAKKHLRNIIQNENPLGKGVSEGSLDDYQKAMKEVEVALDAAEKLMKLGSDDSPDNIKKVNAALDKALKLLNKSLPIKEASTPAGNKIEKLRKEASALLDKAEKSLNSNKDESEDDALAFLDKALSKLNDMISSPKD